MNYDGSPRLRPFDWIWITTSIAAMIWAAYAIPSCLFSFGSGPRIDGTFTRTTIEESQRRGDLIIEEIARFRAAHGRYPESLAEIEKTGFTIQQPTAGTKQWRYRLLAAGSQFQLSFEGKERLPVIYYGSQHAEWRSDWG